MVALQLTRRTLVAVVLSSGLSVGSYSNALAATPATSGEDSSAEAARRTTRSSGALMADVTLKLGLSIQKYSLNNGLRVVFNVDRTVPTVAICVTYGVGSRHEDKRQSGFAHLFEHMMFQGSRHLKKGEYFELVTERGGMLNGTTSPDRTNYFEVLPSNELALGLWLEADRMKWLSVNEKTFENQRQVVLEEYRMRVENRAYARGFVKLQELAYGDYFPYAHDTLGSPDSLRQARFEWVRAFHERHYTPDNAVLSIAGDFDTDRAAALIEKHFADAGSWSTGPSTSPATTTRAGRALSATVRGKASSATLNDPNARTPALLFGYRIPPRRSDEHYALDLLARVLADGDASRLHQDLVRQSRLARETRAWTDNRQGDDLFGVFVALTRDAAIPAVEQRLENVMKNLRQSGPTPAELDRAKARQRADYLFELQSNLSRAIRLGEFELLHGDARSFAREPQHFAAVTVEGVRNAARTYLSPQDRAVVRIEPALGRETR